MGVFVVGALHFDVVVTAPRLPARDETLAGSDVAFVSGGKGGNQAVAAALHGALTAMAGRVGDDLFAARLLAHLDGAGVDRSQLQTGTGRVSGMSAVMLVSSAGLTMTLLPAARAGPIFQAIIRIGKFQGSTAATTPIVSRTTMATASSPAGATWS